MDNVRLCIIGAGGHARRNIYPSLYRLEGAEILANCDLDGDLAARVAAQHGIARSYTDYDRMLGEQRPDGVIVCIGPVMHARLALESLDRGLHVYTEKPNAPTLAESQAVARAQERSGKVCMVGYKKRFAPAYRKARALIESEDFGRPAAMSVVRTCGGPLIDADRLRGHLLDWTCHSLDLATYLFGPVAAVHAFLRPGGRYGIAANLVHAHGAVSQQLLSNATGYPVERVFVAGDGGMEATVDNSIDLRAARNGQPFAAHRPSFTTGGAFSDIEQGFAGELIAFVEAIWAGRATEATIQQATHTLAVFEAMMQSLESPDHAVAEVAT